MKKYILKTGVLALGILTASVSQAQKTEILAAARIARSAYLLGALEATGSYPANAFL